MEKRWSSLLTGAAMVSAVAVFSGAWGYVSGLQNNKPEAQLASGSERAVDLDLLSQIEAAAAKSRIEPVDARVDSVWKAIPGYNGLEIDIEATYQGASSKTKSRRSHPVRVPANTGQSNAE